MKKKRILSAALALLLVASLPVTAFAAEWNIADGDITVNAGSGGQTVTQGTNVDIPDDAPVIKGSSTTNTVTITAEKNQTAEVTLKDVNIDVSGTGQAAVSTGGDGDVTIELEGTNAVQSGSSRAGLEKNNTGSLTITDTDDDGSLTATGGYTAAGIGGGNRGDGSDITITGGEVTANGGEYAAGIGGGVGGDGSNITITGGEVTANGGEYAAGIGGGNVGDGSSITITGGKVTANGGEYAAGIGGGKHNDLLGGGDGSGITISGGDVTANGGEHAAGIGGGDHGSGSNITISGGNTKAAGGNAGAGIGGGDYGSGSSITISGGMTKATGGEFGAGIGGGGNGSGSDITISGGTTKAAGGDVGAGIGGGGRGSGSEITVSGDAQVKVQGGNKLVGYGTGASIGNPGGYNGSVGAEVAPDVSELTAEGKIEYYEPGADMEKDAPIEDKTVIGKHEHQWVAGEVTKEPTCTETGVRIDTCISDETKSFTRTVELPLREHEFKDYVSDNNASYTQDGTKTAKCVWYDQCGKTHTVQDEGSRLIRTDTAPLYRVKDADGRGVNYKAERKDGVLTITVDADFAVLTGTLSGISALKVQGVEKIIFVTKGATSTFATADLLKQGAWGETYHLTHDGSTITFTLGEPPIDVSGILEKT